MLLFNADFDPKNEVPGSASLVQGERLMSIECDDSIVPGEEPVEHATWSVVSGSATLTVHDPEEPTPWGSQPFTGDVHIEDLVVQFDGGAFMECSLPDVTWTDLSMGWFPG